MIASSASTAGKIMPVAVIDMGKFKRHFSVVGFALAGLSC